MAALRPDRRISYACLLAALLGSALPCSAQRESEFLGVKSWQGSLKVKANHLGTNSAEGGKDEWDFQWSANLQFKLDEFVPFGQLWRGKFIGGSAAVRHKNVFTSGGCTFTSTVIGEGLPTNPEFFLYVGPGNNYSLQVVGSSIPARITQTTVCKDGTGVRTNDGPASWFPSTNPGRNDHFALPATGFDLIGGGKYNMGGPIPLMTFLFGGSLPTFLGDVNWDFHGLASPLEVIIEPQGYDQWRPESAADEATPGNDITVKATLQHEDGSPPSALEKAQKFEFQLANVSKEPGIAMNYPLAAEAKNTPDLQFDKARNDRLPIILIGTDQADSFGLPHETASAIVSAYDWGAWGEIKVTAVTGDGRRIVGYLKGDKLQTSVRLPKRAKDSFIADGWKTSKGLSSDVQDKDDKEKEPESLPGCDGDGLTVYEEYRGFIEKGKHIEGNLDKKDFFILNLIGADAEWGIWWFTDLTQLEVHKDLKEDEMSKDDRLINGNCDKCPHRVAQHGVYLEEVAGISGGETFVLPYNEEYVRARPGLTLRIEMTPRMALEAGNYTSMSSLDTPLLYDKIVAHELSHSVGLAHHGEGDKIEWFWLYPPDHPDNDLGRPFLTDQDGHPVTLLDEKTERDVIDRLYSAYVNTMAYIQGRRDSGNPLDLQSEAEMVKSARAFRYFVGRPSQQHSGAVECIMRYSYARAYPKKGTQSPREVFYLPPPGTEPMGSQLCDTRLGTKINAPREPQPRYFGAADGRGNCSKWVCVNDDIPPGR